MQFDIWTTRPNGSIHGAALWGRDFANVFTSGNLFWQGKLDILYSVEAYRAFQDELFGPDMLKYHNYSYPPVSLLYTPLFALLPYYVALVAWLVGTGSLFHVANLRGVQAGAILAVDGNVLAGGESMETYNPHQEIVAAAVNAEIDIALQTLAAL